MHDVRFVWDMRKASSNLKKHGISFDEAQTVFLDQNARQFYDPLHTEMDEDRFLLLGLSGKLRLLMICHCFREDDREIRIISARKATNREASYYRLEE